MKRLTMLLLAALIIAGCGGTSVQEPSDPAGLTKQDRLFLNALRKKDPLFQRTDGGKLIDSAELVCESLDLGLGVDYSITIATDNGWTPHQARTLTQASIIHYCPRHSGNP